MRVYPTIAYYVRGIDALALSEFVFKRMDLTPYGKTVALKRAAGRVFKNATFPAPVYCIYPG